MKYIRTKDGIFKVWNWWNNSGNIPEPNVETIGCYVGNGKDISIDDIIKQSDTIEELCDKCVCFIDGEYEPYICSVLDIRYLRQLEQFGGNIRTNRKYNAVYLAIWTDKGLIYVAKMNEEGEMELL